MTEYGGSYQSLQVSLGYTRRIFRLPVFQILPALSYRSLNTFTAWKLSTNRSLYLLT
jgi:hypothetical protein